MLQEKSYSRTDEFDVLNLLATGACPVSGPTTQIRKLKASTRSSVVLTKILSVSRTGVHTAFRREFLLHLIMDVSFRLALLSPILKTQPSSSPSSEDLVKPCVPERNRKETSPRNFISNVNDRLGKRLSVKGLLFGLERRRRGRRGSRGRKSDKIFKQSWSKAVVHV